MEIRVPPKSKSRATRSPQDNWRRRVRSNRLKSTIEIVGGLRLESASILAMLALRSRAILLFFVASAFVAWAENLGGAANVSLGSNRNPNATGSVDAGIHFDPPGSPHCQGRRLLRSDLRTTGCSSGTEQPLISVGAYPSRDATGGSSTARASGFG
jgi:hypothetical protein